LRLTNREGMLEFSGWPVLAKIWRIAEETYWLECKLVLWRE
jgi:hypothetical protein